ncbi:MAG: cell division protein FtsL [Deltaproteobacteria bacterium]|jgi:cell division protein FtsL|nr:cell division protein FtsL [Deltaproteobacteria bacterium]MBN2844954.1 cell division protein FtsL [Deltaproteobacteria bacterium]
MMKADDRKLRLRFSHFIFATLIFMAIALVYVWFHIQVTRINYQIAEEIQNKNKLDEENRRLKVEIATLTSPQRIETIARIKLKMCYPKRDQVVFLK